MINKYFFSKASDSKPLLFLDRDGVINIRPKEHEYVTKWSEFKFAPQIVKLLSGLKNDYQFVVVTNQQGIAKGCMTESNFKNIMTKMVEELNKQQIQISSVYFCPHHSDDGCDCRKPKPGLILDALTDYGIKLSSCALIGDSPSDIAAGKSANIKKNYLLSSNTITNSDFLRILNDLKQ